MKKWFRFKSIYTKFTLIFCFIWWIMNSLTFGTIAHLMARSIFMDTSLVRPEQLEEFKSLRVVIGLIFLLSVLLGSFIIFFVVRSIVRPIKELSSASKEIAKGNFDIQMKVDSPDEIGTLTRDFNLMAKELGNIEYMRNDFVSNVSHEFKTPLTSIKGFARLIKDGDLPKEQIEEYTGIIIEESNRLSLLSSNLLKLSKLDSMVIHAPGTPFSLDEQIRKTILMLEPQWSLHKVEFDINLDRVMYVGDENLIYEVWLNLIQNALKFSSAGSTIQISLREVNRAILFEINNRGEPILEKERERIFERFYQGDKSHFKDGNGLGLAIAKKIVDAENGRISFQSTDGSTTFTVELPSKAD